MICQRECGRDGTNVYADDSYAFFIQVQELWAAAARRMTVRAFRNPAVSDQLFGDYGDGAALQAGLARQVSARDRLMRPDEVEHDATIDIARRLARCLLKIRQIDSSHGVFVI